MGECFGVDAESGSDPGMMPASILVLDTRTAEAEKPSLQTEKCPFRFVRTEWTLFRFVLKYF
jgi:hypothetical protein